MMPIRRSIHHFFTDAGRPQCCGFIRVVTVAVALATCHAPVTAATPWRFALDDGTVRTGDLTQLDGADVSFRTAAGEVNLAAANVRSIEPVEMPPITTAAAVRLWLSDGSVLAGDDVATSGGDLMIRQQAAEIAIPQNAVQRIAWNLLPGDSDPVGLLAVPQWQSAVPAVVESDLIVIQKSKDPELVFQCVPCAILSIDAEHVTVALDEDRIPVNRNRVAGLVWLRPPSDQRAAGAVVDLTGGRLLANEVQFLPDGLGFLIETAWSQTLTMPARSIRRIDLAAGRTVSLVALPAEETRVEPFFAGLAELQELATAFEPRIVTAEQSASATGPHMLLMPRTTMRWKLPAGVQRLRMQAEVERPQAGGADLVVVVDGTEAVRREIQPDSDDAGVIDLDIVGGRRLDIIVDFPADAGGRPAGLGRLRLLDPRLEK